jgi:general secretion pathway protein K
MALVSVLWGVALLSVIATSLLAAGNVSYRLARNGVELSQNDATADAGINRAILALLDPRPDKRWRVDGATQSFAFNGIPMSLAIQDELGRIDLNYADGSLLAALFRSAGLEAGPASSLVDKVLDWRDPNPSHRLNGAKQNDYREAGSLYQPRNGPFQSVDELKLVMGVTPELFKRVEPALTVYCCRSE